MKSRTTHHHGLLASTSGRAAGRHGAFAAPPAYGINFLDRFQLNAVPANEPTVKGTQIPTSGPQNLKPQSPEHTASPLRQSAFCLQAKLTVNPTGDRYEREADRVAEHVISVLASRDGRSPAIGGKIQAQRYKLDDRETQGVQRKPLAANISRIISGSAGQNSMPLLLQRDVEMVYGTWKTEKYEPWVGDGSEEGEETDRRGCSMQLAFHPKNTVDARKIGLVQQLVSTVGGVVEGPDNPASQIHDTQKQRNVPLTEPVGAGHRIDRGPEEFVPIYGAEIPKQSTKRDWTAIKVAKPETQLGYRYKLPGGRDSGYAEKVARLLDTPNRRNAEKNSSMEFETTALAVEGIQASTYYGSVRWGWKTDAAGKHELIPLSAVSEGKPSADFMAAAEQWNKIEGVKGFPLPIQRKPFARSRQTSPNDNVKLRPRSIMDGFVANGVFEKSLRSDRGSVAPLPGSFRAEVEPIFGVDFHDVRVHTGDEAVQLNRRIGAQAFTYGKDIYLGEGSTNFETKEAKRLLAHELTHTIQQGAVVPKATQNKTIESYNEHGVNTEITASKPTS